MDAVKTLPFGSWPSAISARQIASGAVRLADVALDGADAYWLELRPTEGGRHVLVRAGRDMTPPGFDVRTRVHEYGGGAFTVHREVMYFVNNADQRIYRHVHDGVPEPITTAGGWRYADLVVDEARNRLIAVGEEHVAAAPEARNCLVTIALDGGVNEPQVIAGGADFYASPKLSHDGMKLAWLTWSHPHLPWEQTTLWLAELDAKGAFTSTRGVGDTADESVFQPEWSKDDTLHFVSDRTGWWNLYRLDGTDVRALCPMEAEFGLPQWVFGQSTYGFTTENEILCTYHQHGRWNLARLDPATATLTPVATPYTEFDFIRVQGARGLFLGSSPTRPVAVVQLDLRTSRSEVHRSAFASPLAPEAVSIPEPIGFPTTHGRTAHAFFYAPNNPTAKGPDGARPPLIVICHGGPTGATTTRLQLAVQYWTGRGIAVLDVDYSGSTGYGRAYRDRLRGQWGVADVDDCVSAAKFLVDRGDVDGARCAIRGGSAGGYTTLAALAFRDFFRAGASYYGVSDIEVLIRDTHKFESRYDRFLIGPYPESAALYRERSPIHHLDRFDTPLIVFQGTEDKVVPPNQSELIVHALEAKGVPVAYLAFAGEQHGFRRAENIERALEAELYFYGRVFGFTPADAIEPVSIANLP